MDGECLVPRSELAMVGDKGPCMGVGRPCEPLSCREEMGEERVELR